MDAGHKKSKQKTDKKGTTFVRDIEKHPTSVQMIEVSLFGAGTVLRLERSALSMVTKTNVSNNYALHLTGLRAWCARCLPGR